MKTAIPLFLAFLLSASAAGAQSAPSAQSDTGSMQYPAPACSVPAAVDRDLEPVVPSGTSIEEAERYNAKVRAYRAALLARDRETKSYAACMQDYVAAGKADIQRIQAAIDAATGVPDAAASAPERTNIGLARYPAPKCDAPPPMPPELTLENPANNPTNPRRPNSEMDVFDYNRRVRAHNAAVSAHNDGIKANAGCLEGYVAAAKADIRHIQTAVNDAVAAANARNPQ